MVLREATAADIPTPVAIVQVGRYEAIRAAHRCWHWTGASGRAMVEDILVPGGLACCGISLQGSMWYR